MARRQRSGEAALVWARTDWGLVIAASGLSVIGALLVWSATRHVDGSAYLVRHLLNTAIGVALFVLVSTIDARRLRLLAPWLYLLSVVGLVVVLTAVGSTINGSHSWIRLPGGFSAQPSELAKDALCVGMAVILAHRPERGERPTWVDVLVVVVVAGLPIALVLLQPDLGSTLVLAAMGFGVVASSGVGVRWLVAGLALAGAGIALALWTPVLDQYQRARLTAFAHPQADLRGVGYQTNQVRIAIGSGGWTGQGLFHGHQTQGGLIPFQQTDFVFSVAGEELGYLGAVALILLLGFVIARTLLVAIRTSEAFSRLVAVGVACWFAFQVFENVGMNLGLTPVTGLPLPFLSYGGSSMFACWIAVGLVNNAQLAGVRRR